MHVGSAVRRRHRRAHHLPLRPALPSRTSMAAAGDPDVSKVSRASGPFPVDWVRAHADARRTLDQINWAQRDVVIWVPGTGSKIIHPAFEDTVRGSWTDGRVSLVRMHHEASWNMRPSVATGIATMKLVLAGIAAHGGDHRIMLAGESQGAWIIGEAMADPMLRRVVSRAFLLGHPWLATHHYDDKHDPDVRVINNDGDLVTMSIKGDSEALARGLDAMVAIYTGRVWKLPLVISSLLANPIHGWKLISSIKFALPGANKRWQNPHHYDRHMKEAVAFLRSDD